MKKNDVECLGRFSHPLNHPDSGTILGTAPEPVPEPPTTHAGTVQAPGPALVPALVFTVQSFVASVLPVLSVRNLNLRVFPCLRNAHRTVVAANFVLLSGQ